MKFVIATTITAVSVLALGAIGLLALSSRVSAESAQTCQFDPDLGLPNPLGMRSYITIEAADGDTIFLYEQFPSITGSGEVNATIASNRVLTFYGVGIEDARQLMLDNPDYYSELVGYQDSEGFAPVNAVLTCTP